VFWVQNTQFRAKKMVAPQRPSANYNPMNISLVRTKDTVIIFRKPTQKNI